MSSQDTKPSTHTQRHTQRDTHTHTQRHTETHTHTHTHRHTQTYAHTNTKREKNAVFNGWSSPSSWLSGVSLPPSWTHTAHMRHTDSACTGRAHQRGGARLRWMLTGAQVRHDTGET